MPAIPFGGLSFFLNVTIVMFGVLIRYFERKGFSLRWMYAAFAVIVAKKYDSPLRRMLGFAIMLSIFFFLFASTGVSFAKRMQVETNVSMIEEKINAYYHNSENMRVQSQTKQTTL